MNARLALRGDLLDFAAAPAWGDTESAADEAASDTEPAALPADSRTLPAARWGVPMRREPARDTDVFMRSTRRSTTRPGLTRSPISSSVVLIRSRVISMSRLSSAVRSATACPP